MTTVSKKQAEVQINARVVAISTDQSVLTSGNVSVLTDDIVFNGHNYKLSTLDATGQANLAAAIKTLFNVLNSL